PHFNPTIAGGRMYVQRGNGKIAALDPATGRELWISNTTGRIGGRGVNYWRGANGDERLMLLNDGMVRALDAKTGQVITSFGTDTWPEKDREKMGGVHNWSEFTIDPETGIAYIPTGTARYDFYGGNRPGNNLFANSLIAIDARTGKRVWHYQLIHHDLWDFD